MLNIDWTPLVQLQSFESDTSWCHSADEYLGLFLNRISSLSKIIYKAQIPAIRIRRKQECFQSFYAANFLTSQIVPDTRSSCYKNDLSPILLWTQSMWAERWKFPLHRNFSTTYTIFVPAPLRSAVLLVLVLVLDNKDPRPWWIVID